MAYVLVCGYMYGFTLQRGWWLIGHAPIDDGTIVVKLGHYIVSIPEKVGHVYAYDTVSGEWVDWGVSGSGSIGRRMQRAVEIQYAEGDMVVPVEGSLCILVCADPEMVYPHTELR
ncbi:hypothetical protein KIPB_011502 [Kipferlia bialata]|uniref:Uncharacterized protein n=1 Tax=Kipferlia bialata TaxID=797122 RepID=A0A391NQM1_9EUKA|nr:hypothetical protein KIPB_011502 [Kipferlia bialata]|eukprot:g11502.t1